MGAAAPRPMLVAPGLAILTVVVTAVRVLTIVMPMMHASICSASCIDRGLVDVPVRTAYASAISRLGIRIDIRC